MKKKEVRRPKKQAIAPKKCLFCSEKKTPDYADVSTLQRFTTERGKIIGRARSGICAKHQRQLTAAIKHARHLALMPFILRD